MHFVTICSQVIVKYKKREVNGLKEQIKSYTSYQCVSTISYNLYFF
jgi:hypothetical protein